MRDRRTFLLLLAAVLVVAAVLVNLRPRPREEPVTLIPVVVASEDIGPYAIIEPDQVTMGSTQIPQTLASQYYEATEDVAGLMTTRFVKAGQQIGREDAKPVEKVRYVEDMGLEIVSFPAVFSEMVAGQVKPGHRINIYGYQEERGGDKPGEAVLVASNVWVVDVRTATGEEIQQPAEQEQQESSLFSAPGAATLAQPASVVAVAAPPSVVQDIIYAFGAKGYQAWVSLAPREASILPVSELTRPTPVPEVTSPAAPGSSQGQETPTLVVPQAGSLVGAIYMSDRDGGSKVDLFPNNTTVVWAVVNLQYSPDGATPIRIDIRDGSGRVAFEGDFVHPKSGQTSYLIVPPNGFSPDTSYTTTLYVSGKTFSVDWRLHGNSVLPKTGGDS